MYRLGAFIIMIAVWTVSAQICLADNVVYGTVKDASGNSVEAAVVTIKCENRIVAYDMTDEAGKYRIIYDSNEESLRLTIDHMGYESTCRSILNQTQQEQDFELAEKSQQLKEVVVKAPSISLRGDTLSYNLQSFVSKSDYSLRDAIKKLPGIDIEESGKIKYLGKDISNFYIEGLDLLGGQYNIATNNIPASYVSTVQVLNNHNAAKIDKGTFSDNVALNVKLFSSVKFRPVGTIEAVTGYGDEWLYQLSGAGMLFDSKIQAITTTKIGNIDEFSIDENADHYEEDENVSYTRKILGDLSASDLPLARNRYLSPFDGVASLNFISKVSADATLKANIGYAHSQTQYDYSSVRNYFDDSGNIVIGQQMIPSSQMHKPTILLEYKDNGATRFTQNTFSAQASFLQSGLPSVTNGNEVTQQESYRDFNIKNKFTSRWRRGHFLYSATSDLSYLISPTGFVEFDTESEKVQQQVGNCSFIMNNGISAVYETLKSRISFPLSVNLSADKIETDLTGVGNDDPHNSLRGENVQFVFSPKYEYTHPDRKYVFHVQIDLQGEYLNYWNNGSSRVSEKAWRFSINPSLYFNYAMTANSTWRTSLDYEQNNGDILNFLTAPVQTDITSRSYRAGILDRIGLLRANLHYDYRLPLSMWFVNADFIYQYRHGNLLSSQNVSQNLVLSYYYPDSNNMHNLSALFAITKQFPSINTKISLQDTWMWQRQSLAQNEEVYDVIWNNVGFSPKVTSQPFEFLELEYSYILEKTFNYYRSQHKSYLSQSHDISLKLMPAAGLQLFASTEITKRDLATDVSKVMSLFDAGISYNYKSMYLGINILNILDTKSYNYTIFNGVNAYTYDYHLRGRTFLVNFRMQF